MESTPENLPERLRWFSDHREYAYSAPLVEAADEIEQLREYGDKMRQVCQQLSKRLEELDPTAPRAEAK